MLTCPIANFSAGGQAADKFYFFYHVSISKLAIVTVGHVIDY